MGLVKGSGVERTLYCLRLSSQNDIEFTSSRAKNNHSTVSLHRASSLDVSQRVDIVAEVDGGGHDTLEEIEALQQAEYDATPIIIMSNLYSKIRVWRTS